jgi:tetratricopeptide (TPR) repeat protein
MGRTWKTRIVKPPPQSQEYIRSGSVPIVFREAYAGRRTGLLHFGHGEKNCSLRFVKGHVVYGASSAKQLHLGQVLYGAGMVTKEQLEAASVLVVNQHKRLGEALTEIGALGPEDLEHALALHVQSIMAHILVWTQGLYYFEERDAEQGGYDQPLKTSTGQLLLEAARMVKKQSAVRFCLGDLDRVLLPSTDPLLRFQRVRLTPIEGFVMSRLDGTITAAEVVRTMGLPEEEVEGALLALLICGMVDFADRKGEGEQRSSAQFLRQEVIDLYRSLNDKNHFELLGVPEDAQDMQIESAYLRLAKRYHPDTHHEPGLEDLADKLESIFYRLTEAFETLEDAPARLKYLASLKPSLHVPEPEPPGPRPRSGPRARAVEPPQPSPAPEEPKIEPQRAQEVFEQAQERFGEGKYWEAVGLLSVAVSLGEGRLQRRARVLMARCFLKYPDRVKDAEKQLRLVIDQDPNNADAYYHLGAVYRHGGLSARARAMLKKTLELKPKHREAAAELATLEGADSDAGEGVLKKLFSRD